MPADMVVTRFAPSPTGELHLGNARTALERPYADLGWLGVTWDEGPGREGPLERVRGRLLRFAQAA